MEILETVCIAIGKLLAVGLYIGLFYVLGIYARKSKELKEELDTIYKYIQEDKKE